ncbi:MAG: GNAT family N-acetyltransferase [Candidatus Hydrogenedens sp.]|nr:GNAT family N-acetyltransferase [Candidatus Hydrogenedens sp.]
MHAIVPAETELDLRACHPVMLHLRPQLDDVDEFVSRVQRQREAQQYHLAYIALDGAPQALIGYRITENLSAGPHLYVDDLVTASEYRGRGLGRALMEWVTEEARRLGLSTLHLDSGVQRHPAHRLYISHGMDIVFYHFRMQV